MDASLGRQVAIFNYFTAASIPRGKPVSYEDSLPSPWSSDVIPSRGSFEVIGEDAKAGTVTIRWRQGIDPVKGRDAVWKVVGALGIRRGDGAGSDGMPKGLVLKDEAIGAGPESPPALGSRKERRMPYGGEAGSSS